MSEALQVAGCVAAAGSRQPRCSPARAACARRAARRGARASPAALLVGRGLGRARVAARPPGAARRGDRRRGRPALAALAALIARWPLALPLLLVAALPFRVPIESATEDANLLLPLYAVIARGGRSPPSMRRAGGRRRPRAAARRGRCCRPGGGDRPLRDPGRPTPRTSASRPATSRFFLVPFAAMFVLLAERRLDAAPARPRPRGGRRRGGRSSRWSASASTIAGEIFWNSALELSNDFHFYFRVNSLFWDPNIYGRYLALAAVLAFAVLLWTRDARRPAIARRAAARPLHRPCCSASRRRASSRCWPGSRVVCALRWSWRWTADRGARSSPSLVFAAVVVLGGTSEAEDGADEVTSGRTTLIEGGVDLFTERPAAGPRLGLVLRGLRRAGGDRARGQTTVSHNEPVTVAAEQGAVGLARLPRR